MFYPDSSSAIFCKYNPVEQITHAKVNCVETHFYWPKKWWQEAIVLKFENGVDKPPVVTRMSPFENWQFKSHYYYPSDDILETTLLEDFWHACDNKITMAKFKKWSKSISDKVMLSAIITKSTKRFGTNFSKNYA